jgi:hypothetical protein
MYVRIKIFLQVYLHKGCDLSLHFVRDLSTGLVKEGGSNISASNVTIVITTKEINNGSSIITSNMTSGIALNGTDAIDGKLLHCTIH